MTAIAATGLRKSFGDHVVLDGVDLDVAEGTTFALLGPNGAGKTTMVQILSTLIGADAGELSVAGHDLARDPDAVRAAIGVTGQFSAVDNLLTGQENLIRWPTSTTWAERKAAGAPPSCSSVST
jgi:ABC-2 type transport system ATP-binding protein